MALTTVHSVTLFTGRTVQTNSTVRFDSQTGQIVSVSSTIDMDRSSSSAIDGSGHTLLPGLIDAHVHIHTLHLSHAGEQTFPAVAEAILTHPLQCGVTTICDMHSDPASVNKARTAILADTNHARSNNTPVHLSDVKSSLYGATIAGGWPKPIVLGQNPSPSLVAEVAVWPSVTVDSARNFVQDHKANGADYIKLMQEDCCSLALPTNSIPSASLELQTAIVNAAHAEDMLVLGHATSIKSTEIILDAGADGVTHTFVDAPPTPSVISKYTSGCAFIIPTLTVSASLTGELQTYRDTFAKIASGLNLIDTFTYTDATAAINLNASTACIEHAIASIQQLKQHKVDIVAGTDSVAGLKGTMIGPSLWMELQLYIDKCGFTVLEALKSATSVTADRFGFADRGVVEVGRRADLVLVKGDVLGDLSRLWAEDGIVGVWREGLPADLARGRCSL